MLPTDKEAAKIILDEFSISAVFLYQHNDEPMLTQCAWAGFAHTDCYRLPVPDRMHICKGIEDYILKYKMKNSIIRLVLHSALTLQKAKTQIKKVNAELSRVPKFGDLRIAPDGLNSGKLTAREMEDLTKCMPVALLASSHLGEHT